MGFWPQTKLDIPVIVVGNIFVGGTGKTPLVIWLVQHLQEAGWSPGVISRGYGANVDRVLNVTPDSLAKDVGDEPLLIAQRLRCPLMVGRQRAKVAQSLREVFPQVDVIVSDDGFQHHALARDVEILMFDQRGTGNGFLLPAGPLREPISRRRDFTVLNAPLESHDIDIVKMCGHVPSKNEVFRMHLLPSDLINLKHPEKRLSVENVKGRRLLAAAGIGHPQKFFSMLESKGLTFVAMPLPDHFSFTADFFSQEDAEIILITEKDAVKCRQITSIKNDERVWIVPVSAQLEPHFLEQLLKMLK
jgi:tetraacyldisaccharide 4'-kinase